MADDPLKSPAPAAAVGNWPHRERREVPRYLFIANAEETDLDSGTKLTARVSELSRKGCYLDTLNPFPRGTRIKLRITHEHASFTALARVIYQQPNMGMGIAFITVEPAQMQVLEKWLAEMGGQ
jgi:hypothetical protein